MLFKEIKPGFTLMNSKIKSFIDDHVMDLSDCDSRDISDMKKNYDDFLMYIWMILGDTRFNRLGYRNATDELSKQLFKLND